MSIFTTVTSLLNKAVPFGLAYKGLKKVSPKIANFIAGATAAGYTGEEALNFFRSRLLPEVGKDEEERLEGKDHLRPDEEANLQQIKQSRFPEKLLKTGAELAVGIPAGMKAMQLGEKQADQAQVKPKTSFEEFIKQNPGLGRYMDGLMSKGATPEQAAAKAKTHARFKKTVKNIEKDMGQDFISLIGQLLGKPSAPAQQQEAPEQDSGQDQDRFIYEMIRKAMGQQ